MSYQVSVIMSAFNAEKYIGEAIGSILAQTYPSFECIIINDGSTDTTEEIIKSFSDNRLVYIKNNNNLGLIESLNKGILLAKGNYIARMDADDIALPERLQEQVALFDQKKDAMVVGSDYYLLTGNKLKYVRNENDSTYLKTTLLFSTCFAHPTVMIKNVFKAQGILYDTSSLHAEDYKLWTELALLGEFYNVNKPLLKYREHANQISVQHHEAQLQISEKIRRDYLNKLGIKFSEEQFKIHNIVGNNRVIHSLEVLKSIENWLVYLKQQQTGLEKLPTESFDKALHKFWIDSCGYTSLGLKAYYCYRNSELSNLHKTTTLQLIKLFVKCLVRKYAFSYRM
jgi:glycosyltransferase involved in cell wall biosynthesis